MNTEHERRTKGQYAIHFDSKPDEFTRFEKRSLFMAGYIQGLEYATNVLKTAPQIKANIEAEMKAIAEEIKQAKKRRR